MNKYATITLVFVLGATACGSSTSAVETAIAKTQIAKPTETQQPTQTSIPTLTPIPLSEVDLDGVLMQPGDLPSDFVGGQIKSSIPKLFDGVPNPNQVIQQAFRAGEFASDGVVIFLYESISDLDLAYDIVVKESGKDGLSYSPLSDVGEKAVVDEQELSSPLFGILKSGRVLFARCHALVYIDLFGGSANADTAIAYAQRLDKRLSLLLCR